MADKALAVRIAVADISFWLPRTQWALGETIQGRLSVLAHKDIKFSDIRVELIQYERVPESSGNESTTELRTGLAEKTEMTAGQSLTLPFQIQLPQDGAPSFYTERGSITWTLKGVLARRLATDYHIRKDLEVYSQT